MVLSISVQGWNLSFVRGFCNTYLIYANSYVCRYKLVVSIFVLEFYSEITLSHICVRSWQSQNAIGRSWCHNRLPLKTIGQMPCVGHAQCCQLSHHPAFNRMRWLLMLKLIQEKRTRFFYTIMGLRGKRLLYNTPLKYVSYCKSE